MTAETGSSAGRAYPRRFSGAHSSVRYVHDQLRSAIRGRYVLPFHQLPDEDVARVQGASRGVSRQAILTLVEAGLIRRQRGKGSTAVGGIVPWATTDLFPAHDAAAAGDLGARLTVTRVDDRMVPASPIVAGRLGLIDELPERGAELGQVRLVDQLVELDGAPLVVSTSYVPLDVVVPDLLEELRTHDAVMRHVFGVPVGHLDLTVEAVRTDAATARLLGVSEASPVVLRETTWFDPTGNPRMLTFAQCSGDRVASTTRV